MKNSNSNPYTNLMPTGSLDKVQFVNPHNVVIAWPDVTGGTKGAKIPNAVKTPGPKPSIFGRVTKALFG